MFISEEFYSIHTSQLILGCIGVLFTNNIKKAPSIFRRNSKVLLPLIIFVLFFQFNLSINTPEYSTYKISLLWWNIVAILVFIFGINSIKEFNKLIIFGMIQILIGIFVDGIDFSTYRGAGEPILISRMGAIVFCFALFYNKKGLITLRYLLGGISGLLILLSGNRTIFFSIILIMVIMYFSKIRRDRLVLFHKRKLKNIFLGVFIVFFFLAFLDFNYMGFDDMTINRFLDTFSSIMHFSSHDTSTVERVDQWNDGYGAWLESPFMGQGFGGYAYFFTGVDTRMYPHNIFVELLSEGGVVGLMIFLWLLWQLWKMLKLNLSLTPEFINKFLISLFFLGLISSLTSLEIPNQFILFLSISLILSLNTINNQWVK